MPKQVNKKGIYKMGIIGGLAEIAYVLLVALFITQLGGFMQNTPPYLGIISFLLLFVFSVAVSGLLIFGYPAYLTLQKRYKEAVWSVLTTFLTLLSGFIIAILIIYIMK